MSRRVATYLLSRTRSIARGPFGCVATQPPVLSIKDSLRRPLPRRVALCCICICRAAHFRARRVLKRSFLENSSCLLLENLASNVLATAAGVSSGSCVFSCLHVRISATVQPPQLCSVVSCRVLHTGQPVLPALCIALSTRTRTRRRRRTRRRGRALSECSCSSINDQISDY